MASVFPSGKSKTQKLDRLHWTFSIWTKVPPGQPVDGIEIINALELVDWDKQKIQFIICEACEFTHCKPGDWVSLRKSDSLILMLPPFKAICDESRENEGVSPALLSQAKRHRVRRHHVQEPEVSTPFFSIRRANTLFNCSRSYVPLSLEALAHVLGKPPHINLRRDLVLASSEGDHIDHTNQLEDLIQRQYQDESVAILRALHSGERVITLFFRC